MKAVNDIDAICEASDYQQGDQKRRGWYREELVDWPYAGVVYADPQPQKP